MALVVPFRGFRYNKKVVGDLGRVVTQPYDKTTPSMQDEYYQRSPYNVVRVTLNLEKRENPETSYPDAGATLRQWIDQKALLQDKMPAIYAYFQEYVIDDQPRLQKGFISLLDIRDAGAGIIPHEQTLEAPKQDRLNLMRSTEANEDLIYMLYADESQSIDLIMDACIAGSPPEIEVTDEYGTIHRVWAIDDPRALKGIQEAMRTQKLFIADGHHRFETSINFMKECRQQNWTPAAVESFDKRMVTCFNTANGVTILATHRLVRDLPVFNAATFLQNIEPHFTVERLPAAAALWEKMKQGEKQHVFGFYANGSVEFYLLCLKQSAIEDSKFLQHAKAYRELDVSILHSALLERHLGIGEKKLAAQTNVDYERSRETCIQQVNEGKYQAAFFLNPTTVDQMQHIALMGERMPQKSTDFFPKLLTGLIFMRMEIQK